MKTLLLCRHAKAESHDLPKPDHSRELTDRGRVDAAAIGRAIRSSNLVPDIVLASDSTRTRQTTETICGEWQERPTIEYVAELYSASSTDVMNAVRACAQTAQTVLVVGHNPTMEDVVSELSGTDTHLKTSWTAVVKLPTNSWQDLNEGSEVQLVTVLKPG
jgi:phosphohistidine phosphatase